MKDNEKYHQAEQALQRYLRSGAVKIPPTQGVAAALAAREPEAPLSDIVRRRLLRTVRGAGVDRRIAEVRPLSPAGRSFSEHLRAVRANANLSVEELADRLSISPQHLRDVERSVSALLSWPATALADLLELLDLPLQFALPLARPAGPLFGSPENAPSRAAASIANDHALQSRLFFDDTARILRERGRNDLLANG